MKKEYINPFVKVALVDGDELLQDLQVSNGMGNGVQLGKEDELFDESEEWIHAPKLKNVWDE